jgi:hypothetical protein
LEVEVSSVVQVMVAVVSVGVPEEIEDCDGHVYDMRMPM